MLSSTNTFEMRRYNAGERRDLIIYFSSVRSRAREPDHTSANALSLTLTSSFSNLFPSSPSKASKAGSS